MVNFAQKLNGPAEVTHLTRLYWKLLTNSTSDATFYSNLSNRYRLFESVKNLTYSHYEGPGGSSTVMYVRIPNYFQAILTIFVCVVIMSTTICVILRTKYWCMKYQRRRERNGGGSAIGLNDVKVMKRGGSPNSSTDSIKNDKDNEASDSDTSPQNGPKHPPNRTPRLARRMSGPFNDDALQFAHESYKLKKSTKSSVNCGKPVSKLVTTPKPVHKIPTVPEEEIPVAV